MLQCIGQRKVAHQKDKRIKMERCAQTSETPSDLRWPDIYLCAQCANSRQANSTLSESPNVGGMQCDYTEFRDQIASGFAAGARRSYEGGDLEE
jgi:hypothetical protein